jgi:hypothetical protein
MAFVLVLFVTLMPTMNGVPETKAYYLGDYGSLSACEKAGKKAASRTGGKFECNPKTE